jgi:hypothetical protein
VPQRLLDRILWLAREDTQRAVKARRSEHAVAAPHEKPAIIIRFGSMGYTFVTASIASRPSVSPANRLAFV